jgi:DNA-binding transcriptional LysR family regulator
VTKIYEFPARMDAVATVRLNYNHVMVFLDVAEAGSINAAADVRCVAQSAVSRIVRELELSLKVSLLQRHARGIELTESGKILAEFARTIRAEGNSACRQLDLARSGTSSVSLSVGMPSGLAGFIPQAFIRFEEQVPGCRIVLQEGSKDALFTAVTKGELDIVVCRIGDSDLPAGLSEELIYRDALVVLAGRAYKTVEHGRLSAADVQAASWVLPPRGSPPYKDVVTVFQELGLPVPAPKIETTSLVLIKELLLSGHEWLAVIPRDLFRAELRARQLQILGKAAESTLQPMGIVVPRRASGSMSRHVALFVECLKEVSASEKWRKR